MDPQKAVHRPHLELHAKQGNERVPHFAFLAKDAAAFFKMSRFWVTRGGSFSGRLISSASSPPLASEAANFVLTLVERMLANPEPLRNVCNRIASIVILTHCITLEIVAEIGLAHKGLLTSKLGKKASTNLGAIHNVEIGIFLYEARLILSFKEIGVKDDFSHIIRK